MKKTCTQCNRNLPTSEFYRSRWKKDGSVRVGDGFRNTCKKCTYEQLSQRRKAESSYIRKARYRRSKRQVQEWREKHPLWRKVGSVNLHAKRLRVSGRITIADIEQSWNTWNGRCWICGFPADEVDHFRPINSGAGGTNTPENIRPICRECNQKRDHGWHGEQIAIREAAMLKQIKELIHGSAE